MNLTYLILLFSIFQSNNCVIVDKQTKKNIPYSTIKFLGNNNGIYTSEKGSFFLSNIKTDSVEITNIGYHSLKMKKSDIKDTIFLIPKIEQLSEINIDLRKSKKKIIGYRKKAKELSWHVTPKTELATLIKYNKKLENAYLNKIYIPIGKESFKKEKDNYISIFPKFNSVFRVNIYSNVNNSPNKRLLDSAITINCNENSKNIITIDVSNENINFPKEGLFVGIEMIGKLKNNRVINDKKGSILPSFKFTKKKNKKIISSSYIKTVFVGNKWTNIKGNDKFYHVSKYNMAISLELSIYD